MRAEDITPQTSLIDSNQEEASSYLDGAKLFDISPSAFKEHQNVLRPEVNALELPPVASPTVARTIAESPEHAATYAPDAGIFSWVERQFEKLGNQTLKEAEVPRAAAAGVENQVGAMVDAASKKLGPERQLIELGWKKLKNNGVLDEDDEIEHFGLREAAKNNFGYKDRKLHGYIEELPAEVVAQGADMAGMIWRNKDIIGGITGVGTAWGAAAGSAVPFVGTAAGAAAGTGLGFSTGYLAASSYDAYKATAASTYNDLTDARGLDDKPLVIDERNKQYISHGVGVVSGALSVVTDKILFHSVPWLNRLVNPNKVREIISKPGNSAMKEALIGIGKAMTANGVEESFQEIASIIGEEIGGTYKDGEVAFTNGLLRAVDKIKNDEKTQARLKKAALVGSVAAGTFAGGGSAIEMSINAATKPNALPTDLVRVQTPEQSAIDVLQNQDIIDSTSEVSKKSKLYGINKRQTVELRKQMLQSSNTKYYFDPEDLNEFALGDPTKAQRVREMVDKSGTANLVANAQIAIDAPDYVELQDEMPTISEHAKLTAEGPSPKSAKAWVEKENAAKAQRAEIVERLGIGEKSPEERAGLVQLSIDMSDKDIAKAIGSKEVADAYLTRLDREDVERNQKRPNSFVGKDGKRFSLVELPEGDEKTSDPVLRAVDEDGKVVGQVAVLKEKGFHPAVEVDENSRRNGVASALYDYAERLGYNIPDVNDPDSLRTDDGAAFRKARGKGGTTRFDTDLSPLEKGLVDVNRKRVKDLYESLPDDVTAKEALRAALDTPQPINDIWGEEDYLNQPTFTKAIEGVISESEVARFNEIERAGRMSVVDNIREAAEYEMNEVIDIEMEHAMEAQLQYEEQRIAENPRLALVDKFTDPTGEIKPTLRYSVAQEVTATHHKPGFSVYAMDPRLLTPEQKEAYLKNPQLKKHKAFVKGGISPDDAAQLIGVRNGEQLLRILSETPTRQEVAEARTKAKEAMVRKEVAAGVDLNETAIAKAYNNKIANSLEVLKFMREKSWSTTARSIKRIALPLPRIESLVQQANNGVKQMRVGDLNPNQFKVGARKSQRRAVEAWTKGDFEKAFVNKQAEALNAAFTIESMKAIGEVNKVIAAARKIRSSEGQQILRDAGSTFVKAADEILDLFKLDLSKTNKSIRGSYQRWVRKQVKLGRGNFEINEKYSEIRQSLNDMTVEQAVVIGNRLRSILHSAKTQNKIAAEFGDEHINDFADRYEAEAKLHPDYDEKKALSIQGSMNFGEKFARGTANLLSRIKNLDFILLKADNDNLNGMLLTTISAMMNGTGKFSEYGWAKKGELWAGMKKRMEVIVDDFGRKEWNNLNNTTVQVDEFKDNVMLKNGKLTQGQLLMMLLNVGNDGNFDRLVKGFNTDKETIMSVLDKHLDERHARLAQKLMDAIDTHFEDVAKLHEDMAGVRPEKVAATPFTLKGKVYPGGYWPIVTVSEMSPKKLRKRFSDIQKEVSGEKQFALKNHYHADDMTAHGHTEQRTGNDLPISLEMSSIGLGFERIFHDIAFRKAVSESIKILLHPKVSDAMASIVGKADYLVAVNTVVRAAGSIQADSMQEFDAVETQNAISAKIRGGIAGGYLLFRTGSLLIQFSSLPFAMERMGGKGFKHFANTAFQFISHPHMWKEFYKFAAEINPSIARAREGLEDSLMNPLSKMTPEDNLIKTAAPIMRLRKKVNEFGFDLLGQVDQAQKVVVAMASYAQFVNGDTEGFDLATVQKMTPQERDQRAKTYASTVSRQTLTAATQTDKSRFQEDFPMAGMFFNDARNIINTALRQSRQFKHATGRALTAAGEGDIKGAAKNIGAATSVVVTSVMTYAMVQLMQDLIRGRETPLGSEDEEDDWMTYAGFAPFNMLTESLPFVRDIKYTMSLEKLSGRDKDVVPLTARVLTELKNTANVAMNIMDYYEGRRELSKKDIKALGFTGSFMTGGLMVTAAYNFGSNLYNFVQDPEIPGAEIVKPYFTQVGERIDKFIKDQESGEAEYKVDEALLDELKEVQVVLSPDEKEEGK